MDVYEKTLMVASDFGIAAQLPYVKQLIRGYTERRVHLVWQVRDINIALAAEMLLNGALDEDALNDGWILDISITANWARSIEPLLESAHISIQGQHR